MSSKGLSCTITKHSSSRPRGLMLMCHNPDLHIYNKHVSNFKNLPAAVSQLTTEKAKMNLHFQLRWSNTQHGYIACHLAETMLL